MGVCVDHTGSTDDRFRNYLKNGENTGRQFPVAVIDSRGVEVGRAWQRVRLVVLTGVAGCTSLWKFSVVTGLLAVSAVGVSGGSALVAWSLIGVRREG